MRHDLRHCSMACAGLPHLFRRIRSRTCCTPTSRWPRRSPVMARIHRSACGWARPGRHCRACCGACLTKPMLHRPCRWLTIAPGLPMACARCRCVGAFRCIPACRSSGCLKRALVVTPATSDAQPGLAGTPPRPCCARLCPEPVCRRSGAGLDPKGRRHAPCAVALVIAAQCGFASRRPQGYRAA